MKDGHNQNVNSKTIDLLSTKIFNVNLKLSERSGKFANTLQIVPTHRLTIIFLSYKILRSTPFAFQYKYLEIIVYINNYLKLEWSE